MVILLNLFRGALDVHESVTEVDGSAGARTKWAKVRGGLGPRCRGRWLARGARPPGPSLSLWPRASTPVRNRKPWTSFLDGAAVPDREQINRIGAAAFQTSRPEPVDEPPSTYT